MNKVFLISMLCLATSAAKAQTVTGRIIDEQSQPMPFANVVFVSRADSTFIQGTVTKDNGTFSFQTDHIDGLLRISSVGYTIRYIDARQGDVGDVRMQPDTQTLGEVVVKGTRPQYKMTTGGMTVDVRNSMLKDVGTADDVLSMLPRVQGEDGNFTVFAKGTPEIYINNKKVQNARELKQLKSTDIKSVDVITSPGAKYNAEVEAIIRIKTIKPQGEGVSMDIYSSVKYNEKWTTYDDATVKYRKGGLEVFGNMMLDHDNNHDDNTITTDTHANGNHVYIIQACPTNFWYTRLNCKVGGCYDFNDDNSLGLSYSRSGSPYVGGTAVTQQTITRNNVFEGTVDQVIRMNMGEQPEHEANIYYIGKAGKLGIDFNGSWIWKKTARDQVSHERSQQLGDRDVHTYNVNRNKMLAGKLVLTYPIWKGDLSLGSEATQSNSHGVFNNVEGIISSSDDEIRERNIAGFMEYRMRSGQWSVGGGLRYEAVTSDYYSFGQHQMMPSRRYRDLFPHLAIGWQESKWSIQLSYDKRISRPSYQSLNSNVQYDNRYMYEGGNPLLRPTIKQNIDLEVTHSWLNLTAGYGRRKDIRLSFGSLFQEGTEITIWTSRNFSQYEFYNVSLTASPKLGFYHPTLTLSYWQQDFDTKAYGIATKRNNPKWEINFRNWFTLGRTIKAMLYLHYATNYDDGFTHYAHTFNVNTRVQKSFLEGSLTATLFANDIFRNLRERWSGNYPVATMTKDAYAYTRKIGLSLTYNFNATRSKYKGKGAGNAEKDRL